MAMAGLTERRLLLMKSMAKLVTGCVAAGLLLGAASSQQAMDFISSNLLSVKPAMAMELSTGLQAVAAPEVTTSWSESRWFFQARRMLFPGDGDHGHLESHEHQVSLRQSGLQQMDLEAKIALGDGEIPGALREELTCLAQNIYFEARSEPTEGRVAVAHVVMNRVASSRFPNSICEVVRQGGYERRHRCQFSWWCDGKSDKTTNRAAWVNSFELAQEVYWRHSPDPTNGALWYHADYVTPYWRHHFSEGPTIGRHIFYHKQPKDAVKKAEKPFPPLPPLAQRPVKDHQQVASKSEGEEPVY